MTQNKTRPTSGKPQGQKAPFTRQEVVVIKHLLKDKPRDLALFAVGIDTLLRGVDLLTLKVEDVTDSHGQVLEEFPIMQQKTGKGNLVSLSKATGQALACWIKDSSKYPWDYLFTGRKKTGKPLSTDQYRRLVKKWVKAARLDPKRYSSHSLRRTKAAAVYQATNNVEVVRQLLGHTSLACTSAYLNIGKRQALDIARKIEF